MNEYNIPETFCMAPWTHAMHDTHYVRRLCCIASEPPAESRASHITLEDFKNSEYAKNIRKTMMSGKLPKDCEYCDANAGKQGHVDFYKDSFTRLLGKYYEEAISKTNEDGYTTMETKNFDYRFGDICNFKCRHCSSRSSSQIRHEEQQHGVEAAWPLEKITVDPTDMHDILLRELLSAADKGDVETIQWIGGEPLFSENHWTAMNYLTENCDCSKIQLTYITNLSIIEFKGKNLSNLIKPFKGVHIHASLEAGGLAGEYIRHGMNWETWKENFSKIKKGFPEWRPWDFEIRPGITLTSFSLPGLREFLDFVIEQNIDVANVTFHKPNPNNLHFDIDALGSYKKLWLDEFKTIVEERKTLLKEYSYKNLTKAHEMLTKQSGLDLDNLPEHQLKELKRSVAWANKTDAIRKSATAVDVIKDYPFMLEWWAKINAL